MKVIQRLVRVAIRSIFCGLAVALAALPAHADDAYARTRYPIMLVHGALGWGDIGGYDYFYGIPDALRASGAQVFVAQVSALNSSEARGEQLLTQVRQVLATTGAAKVNLIGHSHGSPTSRYVAAVAPQLVASVTSVGGANGPSKVADLIVSTPEGPLRSVVLGAFQAVAEIIGKLSGKVGLPEKADASGLALSTLGSVAFNERFPQGLSRDCGNGPELVQGVRYFSWTGTQPLTSIVDPSDAPLGLLSLVHGEPNDGLVTVCSSRLGRHLGDYPQNHLDEINQFFGMRDPFSVSPVTLYLEQANRLKTLGL
ncbi:triacylglycerol lipase [Variovorax dokdonensis]|uniref:Triacylglycerol lipase n=1 Tax=Variovorax dokdonensis TaxID=344883 RepID=A0ABT7NAH1_9BURK|nr:triacylglycerol lipase [Variovorax dokdonensis]MDM0044940.1 triacylglycerol lipase [Variovorax dokdonensis]